MRASLAERLAARVNLDGPWSLQRGATGRCQVCTRGFDGGGYGRLHANGQGEGAHRVAWALAHGSIPAGLHVLHRCDNPPCVNVDHLFLGTHADNVRDRYAKGR